MKFLRKKYWLPSEHGSWVWWMGPFLVGLVVGGAPAGGVTAWRGFEHEAWTGEVTLTAGVAAPLDRRERDRDLVELTITFRARF